MEKSTCRCAGADKRERNSGEIIAGRKPGRLSEGEITLFDSTGISLQDSATVPLEYERAVAAGVGVEKKMIST
jgi:alanine dehydrogenase